jgi:hypothetical protein
MTISPSIFESAVNRTVKGVDVATSKVVKLMGVPKDPSVRAYSMLEPSDFDQIVSQFGEGPTLDYIKTMELKLQKGK